MTEPISVHISDIRTYLQCRRKHWFSSRHFLNLEPDLPYLPFFLGKGVHHALQYKYEFGQDAAQVFEYWANEELVRLDEQAGGLTDEQKFKLQKQVTLGAGMLAHYNLWVNAQDELAESRNRDANLEWVAIELPDESVPLMDGINFGFRIDGLVRRRDDGTYWVNENKTTRSIPELKKSLDNDIQAGMYAWAVGLALKVPISGVLYNLMRKDVPTEAKQLKDGTLTQSKSTDTTFEQYKHELDELAWAVAREQGGVDPENMGPVFDEVRKRLYELHRDMLQHLWNKPNTFFERVEVRRTVTELGLLVDDVRAIAEEMLSEQTIRFPSPLWTNCNFCMFKRPCIAMNKGVPPDIALREGYRQRQPWTEPAIELPEYDGAYV